MSYVSACSWCLVILIWFSCVCCSLVSCCVFIECAFSLLVRLCVLRTVLPTCHVSSVLCSLMFLVLRSALFPSLSLLSLLFVRQPPSVKLTDITEVSLLKFHTSVAAAVTLLMYKNTNTGSCGVFNAPQCLYIYEALLPPLLT